MKDKKGQILIIVLLLMVSFLPMKGNIKTKLLLEHKSNLSVSSYPSQQTLKGIGYSTGSKGRSFDWCQCSSKRYITRYGN